MLIDLPEPISRRMELIAEPRIVKGAYSQSLQEVDSWIELAEPQHITLSKKPAIDDSELEQFLAADKGRFRYDYVRLGCTFCPRNDERFEKAWLKVTLEAEPAQPVAAPISWSLFPLNEYDSIKESVSAKITAPAKILNAEVGTSSEITKKLYSLRGYREGKPDPFWEMYSNQASTLDGSIRLHMVVRSAATSSTVGKVRLEAVISNRSYVLFREKRPFDEMPSAEFRLPLA